MKKIKKIKIKINGKIKTINEIIDLKKDKLLVEKTELCVYEL